MYGTWKANRDNILKNRLVHFYGGLVLSKSRASLFPTAVLLIFRLFCTRAKAHPSSPPHSPPWRENCILGAFYRHHVHGYYRTLIKSISVGALALTLIRPGGGRREKRKSGGGGDKRTARILFAFANEQKVPPSLILIPPPPDKRTGAGVGGGAAAKERLHQ